MYTDELLLKKYIIIFHNLGGHGLYDPGLFYVPLKKETIKHLKRAPLILFNDMTWAPA